MTVIAILCNVSNLQPRMSYVTDENFLFLAFFSDGEV